MNILLFLTGFVLGAVFAAYRLKGSRSWADAARVVIKGGGGPGEPDQGPM